MRPGPRGRRAARFTVWSAALGAAVAVSAGCAQTTVQPSTQPVAQAAEPAVDPQKARLTLAEIQPVPLLPPPAAVDSPEPPAPALRYLRAGQERYAEQLWTDAVTQFEKALQLAPTLVDARVGLARAAMQQGNRGLAENHLLEALKHRPDDVAIHQLLGEIAWQENRAFDAVQSLRRALICGNAAVDRPETVFANLTLALALRKEGYLSAAVDRFEAYFAGVEALTPTLDEHPELRDLVLLYRGRAEGLLAEVHTDLGDHARAVAAYRRAVAHKPDDAGLRRRLALSLAHAGESDEALQTARRLIHDSPGTTDGLALLEEVCTIIGEPQRYDAELTRLAEGSDDLALLRRLADRFEQQDRLDDAVRVWRRVAQNDANDPEAPYRIAALHAKQGDDRECLASLADGLGRDADSLDRADTLLTEIAAGPRLERLVDAAATLADQRPEDGVVHYLLGRLLMMAGRTDEALDAVRRSVRTRPKFEPAHVTLCGLLIRQRRWEDVIAAATAADADGVQSAAVYVARGRAHEALDDAPAAESAYLEAVRLGRRSVDALLALARLSEERNEPKRAEQVYLRILNDVDPKCVGAREALVLLYLNAQRVSAAEEYFSDFERLDVSGPAVERCRARLAFVSSQTTDAAKRLEEFRADLRKIIESHPDEISIRIDLAQTWFAVGEFDKALAETDAALARAPDHWEARSFRRDVLRRLLRFEEAEQVVRGLLAERPRSADLREQLVEIVQDRADYAAVVQPLRELLDRKDLEDRRALWTPKLIFVLRHLERFDEAVELARAWHDEKPDDALRRELHIDTLAAAGRHDEAVAAARQWLDDDPTDYRLRRLYVGRLEAAGRRADAERRVLTWLDEDPDDARLNELLNLLLRAGQRWDDALEVSRAAMEAADTEPEKRAFRTLLGQTYAQARRFDSAIDVLQDVLRETEATLRRNPNDRFARLSVLAAHDALIGALMSAERFADAERVVNRMLSLGDAWRQTGDLEGARVVRAAEQYLSTICQWTNRIEQSFRHLEGLWRMTPGDPGINNDFGYVLADHGRELERAEKMIRYAVSAEPRNTAFLDSLGWVLYKLGRNDQALTYLDRATRHPRDARRTGDEDPVVQDHLGDALYRAGRADDARTHWRRALDLTDPQHDPPPTIDLRRLHDTIAGKLEQLDNGRPVDVAPVGESGAKNLSQ